MPRHSILQSMFRKGILVVPPSVSTALNRTKMLSMMLCLILVSLEDVPGRYIKSFSEYLAFVLPTVNLTALSRTLYSSLKDKSRSRPYAELH